LNIAIKRALTKFIIHSTGLEFNRPGIPIIHSRAIIQNGRLIHYSWEMGNMGISHIPGHKKTLASVTRQGL
jgi:hypothetical protein